MPEPSIDRLVFAFNADAGRWNALLDSARKALSIGSCTLCALTHGLAGERPEWREARATLGVPVVYLHRDELAGPIAALARPNLPCVVAETRGAFELLVTPAELAACAGRYDAFERLLRARVDSRRSGLS